MQQTWLKAAGADLGEVTNVPGWLTTVVSRECLDMLRQRRFHQPLDDDVAAWDHDVDDGDVEGLRRRRGHPGLNTVI